MYKNILVTLDTTGTDRAIIDHIKQLATTLQSRVVLFHVATDAVAKWRGQDAGTQEIEQSRVYLESIKSELENAGIECQSTLAYGDPVKEIVKWVKENNCDLVAMSTHGHQFVADLVLGRTASRVQHSISVPMLLLRAK
jgi:nucleotide-binding universal stress UspA family protein